MKLLFDEKVLDKLYFGDEDLIRQMFVLFLDQLKESVDIIEKGYQQEDFVALKGIFHKMRPSFKMVGFSEIFEEFEVHELKMKDEDLEYLKANYDRIMLTIDSTHAFIEERLQKN